MRTATKTWIVFTVLFMSMSSMAQNLSRFLIKENPADDSRVEHACKVSDLIIYISSPLDELTFESNVIKTDSFKTIQHRELGEYAICHPNVNENFVLTVKKEGYTSIDIPIDGFRNRYNFTITGELVKGSLHFISNPSNAYVQIEGMTRFTTPEIQKVPSAAYKAKLSKKLYVTIDTIVTFPIDDLKEFSFVLKPDFPSLKFDIQSLDSTDFRQAPVLWIDQDSVILEGLANKRKKPASFDGDVILNTVYDDSLIPVEPGYHQIKIGAPGFNTFEIPETQKFENGKINNISARLTPYYGYLNVVDDENNEGADIFLDGKPVGKAPKELKIRTGSYKINLVKPGYTTMENQYKAVITKDSVLYLPIPMYICKQVNFVTRPTRCPVILEGGKDSILGYTPFRKSFQEGVYSFRIEKKSGGFVTEKHTLIIDEKRKDNDTVTFYLKTGEILKMNSETSGLDLELHGLDTLKSIFAGTNLKTPCPINIPYGKYYATLKEGNLKRYHGTVIHNAYNNGTVILPCYSNKSFKPIVADFRGRDNFEFTFGQSYFLGFTGLSTGILNVEYYSNKFDIGETEPKKISMLITSIFFLNWDFRIGGSIMRNLDICALGRFKYSPGLKFADFNVRGYNDASMITGFYGLELTTRLPYVNFNCKAGMQHLKGTCNIYDGILKKYETDGVPVNFKSPVLSVGLTVNRRIDRSNNMLRLWYHPPVNLLSIYTRIKMKLTREKGKA